MGKKNNRGMTPVCTRANQKEGKYMSFIEKLGKSHNGWIMNMCQKIMKELVNPRNLCENHHRKFAFLSVTYMQARNHVRNKYVAVSFGHTSKKYHLLPVRSRGKCGHCSNV